MIRIALLLFALCATPSAVRAQAEAPDVDEYAVWSAVLDSLMGALDTMVVRDSVFMGHSTLEESVLRVSARSGMEHRVDSAAMADFLRPDRPGARLEARFSTRRPVVLVRGPIGADRVLVFLSRAGFDPQRRRAVVRTAMTCGDLCGEGNLFALEREPGGRWKIVWTRRTWIS
jgi:hypothetical protein